MRIAPPPPAPGRTRQLGHAGIAVTERHDAISLGRGGDEFLYVEPVKLEDGEVPADLLSRLDEDQIDERGGNPFALPDELSLA